MRSRERGQSTVEFALVFPVFCALMFGLIAGGILFFQATAVSSAAQGGAREALVESALDSTGSCESGLPTPIEVATQHAANIVPVDSNPLCQEGTTTTATSFCSYGEAATLVQTPKAGDATIELCAEGGLDTPKYFKVKVSYLVTPLAPILGARVTLTSTSILAAQANA
jgi:Flp pilus assembly protein TadG